MQGDLFAGLPELLTIGEVETLFCDELGVGRATFYRGHRPFLPVVYTALTPTGTPDPKTGRRRYKRGGVRVRRDVALELVELVKQGDWLAYASGEMLDERPELYPRADRQAA